MASLKKIHKAVNELVAFINKVQPLISGSAVDFIVHDHWNNILPSQIRCDLMNVDLNDLYLIPKACLYAHNDEITKVIVTDGSNEDIFQSLEFFLAAVRKNYLKSYGLISPKDEFVRKSDYGDEMCTVLPRIMSAKKVHEVFHMSHLIARQVHDKSVDWIIDVGSGLGYLSSALAVDFQLNVMALDASKLNIKGLQKFAQRYERLHRSVYNKEKNIAKPKSNTVLPRVDIDKNNLTDQNGCFYSDKLNFFGIAKYIKSTDDITSILSSLTSNPNLSPSCVDAVNTGTTNLEHLTQPPLEDSLAIVGLHTCGNLASTGCKLFVSNPSVKFLCNVACCYHLLMEKFDSQVGFVDKYANGSVPNDVRFADMEETPYRPCAGSDDAVLFPLSDVLVKEKFYLGRTARMLALQAVDRPNGKDREHNEKLFWRALLQKIVCDLHGSWPENGYIGKLGAKCETFEEYCRKSLDKLGLNYEIGPELLSVYLRENESKADQLHRYFLLRMSLAPIIEGLIMLDKLAFLHEQGFGNSHIVELFDSDISPRNMALLSFR